MLFDNATLNQYLATLDTSNNPATVLQATYNAEYGLSQQIPMIPWYFAAWIIPSLNTGWGGYVMQQGFPHSRKEITSSTGLSSMRIGPTRRAPLEERSMLL